MKKKLCFILSVLLLTTLLCACGAPADGGTSSKAPETAATGDPVEPNAGGGDAQGNQPIRIGISCCLMQNEFFAGQNEAYKRLDAENDEIEIVGILDGNLDLQRDIDNVTTFVSQNVDVIIISLSDFNSAKEILAIAGDTPVIFTNRYPTEDSILEDDRYTYIGSKEYDGGYMEAEYLVKLLKDRGEEEINYIMFQGELGAQNAMERTDASLQALKDSGLKLNEVLNDAANWDRTEAMQKTEQVLGTGKAVNLIVTNCDEMSLGAIEALKSNGISPDDVVVGGLDGVAAAFESIAAGELKCTVLQDSSTQAKLAIESAIKAVKGEKLEAHQWLDFILVTKDNVDQYM